MPKLSSMLPRGIRRIFRLPETRERLIREAGREPIERDTLYRPVRRDPQGGRVFRDDAVMAQAGA